MLNLEEYWRQRNPKEIVHGLTLPISLIGKYFPKVDLPGRSLPLWYELLELGAGSGELSKNIASSYSYLRVKAVDVNPKAMKQLGEVKRHGNHMLTGIVGDATKWADVFGEDSVIRIESFDGIIVQALLPSLAGQDGKGWQNLMDAVDLWLQPGGKFILHDFRRGDYFYTPLAKKYGADTVYQSMGSWKRRYDTNQAAFKDKKLPYGVFAVGLPGTKGKELEMGDASQLRKMYLTGEYFERLAYHPNPLEINRYLQYRLGYILLEESYDYYPSRGDHKILAPYSLQVWQKGDKYKYHPLLHGRTMQLSEEDVAFVERKRMAFMNTAHDNIPHYFAIILNQMARIVPDSQVEMIDLLADKYLVKI